VYLEAKQLEVMVGEYGQNKNDKLSISMVRIKLKMAFDYIKIEFKKLGSMALIILGAFLMLEHIYTYGGIELYDFLGHEWFAIILLIAGILTANKWGSMKFKEGLIFAWEKIKYVFGKDS